MTLKCGGKIWFSPYSGRTYPDDSDLLCWELFSDIHVLLDIQGQYSVSVYVLKVWCSPSFCFLLMLWFLAMI